MIYFSRESTMNRSIKFVGAILLLTCTALFGATGTYLDDFSSTSYSNSNGTLTWSTSWSESGDDNSPSNTSGRIYITAQALRLINLDNATISRNIDLSSVLSATLSMSINENGNTAETLRIEVYNGTTSSWDVVQNVTADTNINYTLSQDQLTSNAAIRFSSGSGGWGTTDRYDVDNVQFQVTYQIGEAPVITRVGNSSVVVAQNSTYTDAGATASDAEDGDITGSIVTVNPVNTAVVGTYTVTYNVTDSDGNAATEVTRTVSVEAPSGTDSDGDGVDDNIDIDDDNDGILDTYGQGDFSDCEQVANPKFAAANGPHSINGSDPNNAVVGDQFLYTDIYSGVDAIVTVVALYQATIETIDDQIEGDESYFQPAVAYSSADGYSEFQIQFFSSGSSDPAVSTQYVMTSVDNDGSEFIVFDDTAALYLTDTPTIEVSMSSGDPGIGGIFQNGFQADGTEFGGISVNQPSAHATSLYLSTNEFNFRLGGGYDTGGVGRQHSIAIDPCIPRDYWVTPSNLPSLLDVDTDGDGFVDRLDLDSDNDGIPDNVEGQTTSGYIPPRPVGGGFTDANGNGLDDQYESATGGTDLVPSNTDGSGNADYQDTDSDDDGITDCEEGMPDSTTGKVCPVTLGGSDTNGLVEWAESGGTDQGYTDANGAVDTPSTDLQDEMDAPDRPDRAYRESDPCGRTTIDLTAYNWRVVSFPCDTGANGIEALLQDRLGTYGDNANWVMYEQTAYNANASNGNTPKRLMNATDTVSPGVGYWIITDADRTMKVDTNLTGITETTAASTTALGFSDNDFIEAYEITLPNSDTVDWMKVMLGNPFSAEFNLSNVYYSHDAEAYRSFDNVTTTDTIKRVFYVHDSPDLTNKDIGNGGGYEAIDPDTGGVRHSVSPMEGLFIQLNEGDTLSNRIVFPKMD